MFVLALMLLLCAAAPAQADTFYVRVDGGDPLQCTGRSDAPYPGSGSGQDCAWQHPFHALAPDGTRRIAGGDTLRIGSGSYMMGLGAPGAGNCLPGNCYMPPVPSGSIAAPTRILGDAANRPRLWGTLGAARILNLDGSSNVELGHLEVTDQDDCVYSHSNGGARCPAVGTGTWGKYGLYARASQNVWLHDIDIHGLGHSGMWAGGLTDWTLERVRLNRNGRAGWDANIGTGSSNAGAITLREMELGWNGCGERWQSGEAWACWGQQAGGYGDGFGTVTTGGQWLIEDVFVHHNTQDGLDLRFLDGADGTHATLRRIHAMANAGNQIKVKGNALVENSVLIGNCGYFSGQFFMLAADHCRADGTTLLLVFTANDRVVVRHNTIAGEGAALLGTTEGDSSGQLLIQNNALLGYPTFLNPGTLSRVKAGNALTQLTYAGNLVWNVYANACPGDSVCGLDPLLASMPLATFDAEPLAASPLIDRVAPLAEVTSDFLLNPRPRGIASDIGAYEVAAVAATCVRHAPGVVLGGASGAAAAGSTVVYTLALSNNDSAGCSATSFSLAESVPNGWSGTLAATSLDLAPGASGSTTLSVTSAVDASAGDYAIGVGASSNVGAVHTASDTITYTVAAPAPQCTRAAPTIALNGSTAAVPAGSTVSYTVSLTNNDSSACASTNFSLAESVPNGWSGTLGATSLDPAPGASGSTTLSVTSAADAAANGYGIGVGASSNVGATHTASDTITYTVAAPVPVCTRAAPTIGLSGSTAAVPAGSTVSYTVSLTNNDSSECATASFTLADSVPNGWTGSLAATSVTLAPGASGSTTLNVTSAIDAAANSYSIGSGASSNVGAVHTASDTITYTVAAPAPQCTRAAPTIALSGSTAAVPAGSTVSYTVSLTNNDSSACASTNFSLAGSVPNGWSGTLGATSLDLAPGASSSTTLSVTSTADASAGDYAIGVGASSNVGAVHTASGTITYTVAAPAPQCSRAAPTIALNGSTAAVPAGSTVSYTVWLTNNDSSECATTSFSLADSVPNGWSGSLAATSVTLAPGASGSTALNVTSAASATAGAYTITAAASSDAGAIHAVSSTIAYNVAAPAPVCTRAAPTISLTGSTAAVPAGSTVSYTLALTNNDSSECATTSFSLADSVPNGWTGTLGATSVTLAPGASGSTALNVTSAASATAGAYTITATASSDAGAIHAVSSTIAYNVAAPAPVCTRAAPTISLGGPTAAVPAGSTVTYTLGLTNNDSAACAATSFNLTRTVPAGWTGTLGAASLNLAPGASGSTTLAVGSATTADAGTYTVGASAGSSVGAVHSAATTTSYTVAAPTISLQTDVGTDKATYLRGEVVRIHALLRNNGTPVVGAVVTFTIVRPSGGNIVQTATSGSDGHARSTYRPNKSKGAVGDYLVQATWSLGGVSSTGSVTFVVQ